MNLLPHVALSSAAGVGVWAATGDEAAIPVAVAAGVLPDLDHLLDYYVRYFRFNWKYMFLLLHGWEYLAAGVLIYGLWVREPWLLAALLGYATQVGADQFNNRVKWHTYFIVSRALRGFRSMETLGRVDYRGYMAVVNVAPFGKERLMQWFERRTAQARSRAGAADGGVATASPARSPR